MENQYQQQILKLVDLHDVLSIIFTSAISDSSQKKAIIRVAEINNRNQLIFEEYFEKKHFSSIYDYTEIELLKLIVQCSKRFSRVHIQRISNDYYVKAKIKNGIVEKVLSHRSKPSLHTAKKSHNRKKNYSLTIENSGELLYAMGIADENERILPSMQAKYKQVNHFIGIALSLHTVKEKSHLHIVDFGCGKAHLSIALQHILQLQGKSAYLNGFDVNPDVIDHARKVCNSASISNAEFTIAPILECDFDKKIDLAVALHACDTATDDALFIAITNNAEAILTAPCCHQYMNKKIRNLQKVPKYLAAILRDPIGSERLADLATDSLRRDIIRYYGYQAAIFEFTSPEHTTKNIMIKAEKIFESDKLRQGILEEIQEQKMLWGMLPKLAELCNLS